MLNHGSGPLSTTYRRLGARRHAVPPESRMAAIGRKSGRAASAQLKPFSAAMLHRFCADTFPF